MIKTIKLVVLIVLVSGCVPLPLKPLEYTGTISPNAQSFPASITLTTGSVDGYGGDIVPLGSSASLGQYDSSESNFNSNDQKLFVSSLISELNRLKLFQISPQPTDQHSDLYQLEVNFVRTFYSATLGDYEIDAKLIIHKGGTHLKTYQYKLEDRMSFRNIMLEGDPGIVKNRIANTLFVKMIEDIDNFTSEMSARQATNTQTN